jgi:hypothetical protein
LSTIHTADEIQALCDYLHVGFVNHDNKQAFSDSDNIIIEDETGTPVAVTFHELVEATKEPIAIDTKVRLIFKDHQDDSWLVVPSDFDSRDTPEGYQIAPGWGIVTGYDHEDSRSYGGKTPIVVARFIYAGYDPKYWKR